MKRNAIVFALAIMFLVPALAFGAASKLIINSATSSSLDGTEMMVVPLNVVNVNNLMALDIPLGFSEGATLEKVEFTDRVSNFQMKIGKIENENHRVLIGLISMVYREAADLPSGSGIIANLYFKLQPGVTEVEISPIEIDRPNHSLTFYYNDFSSGKPELIAVKPEMEIGVASMGVGSGVPSVYGLLQNKPNPFNPTTTISYAVSKPGEVSLGVFNILGQNVRHLVNEHQEADTYDVIWDGRDNSGNSVASGVYFYRIKINDFAETRKMVLLK